MSTIIREIVELLTRVSVVKTCGLDANGDQLYIYRVTIAQEGPDA